VGNGIGDDSDSVGVVKTQWEPADEQERS
jgi:hypothetical protein